MSNKINQLWFKDCKNDEEREAVRKRLKYSNASLKQLREMLEAELASLETSELQSASYEKSNWPYKQADINGSRRTLKRIISWLTL